MHVHSAAPSAHSTVKKIIGIWYPHVKPLATGSTPSIYSSGHITLDFTLRAA